MANNDLISNQSDPNLLRDRILKSLEQSGYFFPTVPIQVSVTPDRAIHLKGLVDNFYLKQRVLTTAIQNKSSESIEDQIEVR